MSTAGMATGLQTVSVFALELLVQTTVLLAAGLTVSFLVKRWGTVLQTVVLRLTLAAVLAIPVFGIARHTAGLDGLSVPVPVPSLTLPARTYEANTGMFPGQRDPVPQRPAPVNGGVNGPSPRSDGHVGVQAGQSSTASTPSTSPAVGSYPAVPQTVKSSESGKHGSRTEHGTIPTLTSTRAAPLLPETSPGESPWETAAAVLLYTGAIIWIATSLYLFTRLVMAVLFISHLGRRMPRAPSHVQAMCEDAARELGIKAPPVLAGSEIVSPLTAGIVHPYILLPLEEASNRETLREMLLHELTHIARRDSLWGLLRNLGTVMLPFHPLMWVLSFWIEVLSDYICDDYVIAHRGDRRSYAMNIVMYSGRALPREELQMGVGLISLSSPLYRRIIRIMDTRRRSMPLRSGRTVLFALSFMFLCASVAIGFIDISNHPSLRRAGQRDGGAVSHAGVEFGTVMTRVVSVLSHTESLARSPVPFMPFAPVDRNARAETPTTAGGDGNPDSIPAAIAHESGDFPSRMSPAPGTNSAPSAVYADAATLDDLPIIEGAGGDATREIISHADATVAETDTDRSDPYVDSQSDPLSEPQAETAETAQPGGAALAQAESGAAAGGQGTPLPGGVPMPVFATPERIEIPAAKALNVVLEEYRQSDYDLSDPDDLKQYTVYRSLERNQNEPAWSPDGSRIAFTDFSRIWMVPSTGGTPVLVYENFHEGTDLSVGGIQSLCFSPDGREITFQKNVYDETRGSTITGMTGGVTIFSDPTVNIESVNVETGAHRVIIRDAYRCAWSPDGRYLAFLTWTNFPDQSMAVWPEHDRPMLYDTVTHDLRELAPGSTLRFGKPAFTPDRRAVIIAAREGNGTIDLYRYPLGGGEARRLTGGDSGTVRYRNFPECSPDGRWVLYTDYTFEIGRPSKRLMLLSLVTGEIFPLLPEARTNASFGKWSPDGRRICYLSEEGSARYIYIYEFNPALYRLTKPALVFEDVLPLEFALKGNYPNPFNPSTTIEYALPADGPVSLTIYNIMGQTVRRLVDERVAAGRHTAVWDGRTDDGMTCGSGLYIARLTADGRTATHKMTLQK